jgi:DNA-binding SARP family transcriptional activator
MASLGSERASERQAGAQDDAPLDGLFDDFPYGLLLVDSLGRPLAVNPAAQAILGRLGNGPATTPPSCCELVCQHAASLDGECLTKRSLSSRVLSPEIGVEFSKRPLLAAWVTAAPISRGRGRVLFHLRPIGPGERRRESTPRWAKGGRLRIFTLGQTRIESPEGPIGGEWVEQRPGQLLKYLVCRRGEVAQASEIAESLWPDSAARAVGSVRYFVHGLRSKLEPERENRAPSSFVIGRRGGYALNEPRVWVDADEFEHLVTSGLASLLGGERRTAISRLERSIELYRGDFLADEPYAEWAFIEREHLRDLAGQALRALTDLAIEVENFDTAAERARRLAALEPFDSDAQRRHIEICLRRGRRTEALRRYAVYQQRMLRSFGEQPEFTLADLTARSPR